MMDHATKGTMMKTSIPSRNRLSTWISTTLKLGAVLALTVPTLVSAGIIASDDFDSYTPGTLAGKGVAGSGWSGAWAVPANTAIVVDTSTTGAMDFTPAVRGSIRGGARAVDFSGTVFAITGTRQLSTPQTGTFYAGYLLKMAVGNLDGRDTFAVHLTNSGTDAAKGFNFGIRCGESDGSKQSYMVRKGIGNLKAGQYGPMTTPNSTHFLVAKVEKTAPGNYNKVTVWLDPGSKSETDLPNGNITLAADAGIDTISYVNVRSAGLAAGEVIRVDQLRLATTFGDLFRSNPEPPGAPPKPVFSPKALDPAVEKKQRASQRFTTRWTFDQDAVGQLPKGWKAALTGPGILAKWQIVNEQDNAGQAQKAVALVETKNKGNSFNLLLAEGCTAKDLTLRADLKTLGGEEDPGGGLVWRVQDINNYYLARWNANENNFRVYLMKDGKRQVIASANIKVDTKLWHEIEIQHRGNHIQAKLDKADAITLDDTTFTEAGGLGLYAKSDSLSAFNDIRLSVAKAD